MPKSRKRRRRKNTQNQQRSRKPDHEALRPYLRQMQRADEAERRGDAVRVLELIGEMPAGPDGEFFWRPWRVKRLMQVVMFGPQLPGWATSRWILEQALQQLDHRRRADQEAAMRLAVDVRRTNRHPHASPDVDPEKILDYDWVYRQVLLYERGGLAHFLRTAAAADLVAAADHVHEWARTPMGGYRYLGRESMTTSWECLATGDVVRLDNIGSAALLEPDECVLGRLVPTEEGRMFETVPLRVPERVARQVAADPETWIEALEESGGRREPVSTHSRFGFLSDVPQEIYQLALFDETALVEGAPDYRAPLSVVDAALDAFDELDAGVADDPTLVDHWACLAAAVVDPTVLTGIPAPSGLDDAAVFDRLSSMLAEPAATVCRGIASDLRAAA